MTTPNPFVSDLIDEIFGEQPKLAFQARLGQSGLNRSGMDFFLRNTGQFLDRFSQGIAGQLGAGQLPTLDPFSFFGPESGFNFNQELLRFSPASRGQGTSQFAPRTRWL